MVRIAAMETFLNVPPLDLIFQAKIFVTADRLAQNGRWLANFRTGHVRIQENGYGGSFHLGEVASIPQTEHFATLMGFYDGGLPTGT